MVKPGGVRTPDTRASQLSATTNWANTAALPPTRFDLAVADLFRHPGRCNNGAGSCRTSVSQGTTAADAPREGRRLAKTC